MQRMDHSGELGIRSVQIAGSEPELMAQAAKINVSQGAQIIDINMGCPAKKVNKKLAGSALMQHPALVESILTAVVEAVDVPVTLKTRTGWNLDHKNGIEIAQIAERCGIQALAVHGRTRACMYKGEAEYNTIRAIKETISIPVIANGDITSPEQAAHVLRYTGADAIMIGRGAQGNPWIFKQIQYFLEYGEHLQAPPLDEVAHTVVEHVKALHQFYGEYKGVRIARKHVGWYLNERPNGREFRQAFNGIEEAEQQINTLEHYFLSL